MKYLLLSLLSLSVRVAGACDCVTFSMKEAYRMANYVVQVRVVALYDTVHYDLYSQPVRPPFRSGYLPVLSVEKVFKGHLAAGQVITLFDEGPSTCDFYFQTGATYVVFLESHQGSYRTSICQKNFLLSDTASRREFRRLAK